MTVDLDLPPAAEARLRAALDAAATTAPVPPAWDVIEARLDDDGTVPLGRPRRRRGAVLLAAAVLALLGVAAAVLALTGSEPSTVVTDDSTLPLAPATGWYVPVGLPDGWVVRDVSATRYEGDPCDGQPAPAVDGVMWVDRSRRAGITIQSGRCLPARGELEPSSPMYTTSDVDLGGGVTGRVVQLLGESRPPRTVSWVDGDRSWTAIGSGVEGDEVVEAARAAVAQGPLDAVPPGFEEADRWTAPARTAAIEVAVTLQAPSGTRMHYRLETPGHGIGHGMIDPEPYTLPGQDLPVARMWDGDDGGWWAMRVAGFWPGADMSVMLLYETEVPAAGSAEERTAEQEVDTLVAHLRPATTEDWRAFLTGVEHTPVLAEAATYADLDGLDVPAPEPPPDEPPTAGGDTTTTTTTTTTTAPP